MNQNARTEREEEIARRAHALWEAEGRPDGRDKEHWAQAEQELDPSEGQQGGYGASETPGAGSPEPDTGLSEAQAQAGEGVPESSTDDPSQPIAATPEPRRGAGKAGPASRGRRGATTGP